MTFLKHLILPVALLGSLSAHATTFIESTDLEWQGLASDIAFTKPTVTDINDDGLPDIAVGGQDGTITLFRNQGASFNRTDHAGDINVGTYAAPSFLSPNSLFIGNGEGQLFMAEIDEFGEVTLIPVTMRIDGEDVAFHGGENTVPILGVVNDSMTIVIGNKNGDLLILPAPAGTTIDNTTLAEIANATDDAYLAPTFLDFDEDGLFDLVLGGESGELYMFQNLSGTLVLQPDFFAGVNIAAHSAPVIYDWNDDGFFDVITGSQNQGIKLYYQDADDDGIIGDDDCDPYDAQVYLGATEVTDNGIDEDCDGSDATAIVETSTDTTSGTGTTTASTDTATESTSTGTQVVLSESTETESDTATVTETDTETDSSSETETETETLTTTSTDTATETTSSNGGGCSLSAHEQSNSLGFIMTFLLLLAPAIFRRRFPPNSQQHSYARQ